MAPVTEAQEESVGVWVPKGGARKAVAVNSVKCRGPANQQTLTWSSGKVSLWTAAGGGSILPGGSKSLSADQSYTYYAQGDNASSSIRDSEIKSAYTVSGQTAQDKVNVTVVGATIGTFDTIPVNVTNDVSVTLAPNPPGITSVLQIVCLNGSGSAVFVPSGSTSSNITQSTTVKIKGVTVSSAVSNMMLKAMMGSDVLASNRFTVGPIIEITEVSFVNDYGIYDITDPVWKKENNPDNPACYKQDTNLTMNVKLTITPSLSNPITISLKAEGPGSLDAIETNISISGSEATVNGITTTGKLNNNIHSTTPSFTWSFSASGSPWVSAGTSGPHKLYAIYGTPSCGGANFTKSHIDDAVGWALDQSSEADIAHKVMCDVNDAISSGCICTNSFEYIWQGVRGDHNNGMCCCRAKGMSEVMQALGVPDYATIVYVNERPEPGVKGMNPDSYVYCSVCGKWCARGAWWGGFWNNWEGACRSHDVGSTCYAPAGEFEGTYDQIRTAFGPYYWVWGSAQSNTCSHLSPP